MTPQERARAAATSCSGEDCDPLICIHECNDAIAEAEREAVAKATAHKPQSQAAMTEQMTDLISLANRYGLYDAADWIIRRFEGGK